MTRAAFPRRITRLELISTYTDCRTCLLRQSHFFCALPDPALAALDAAADRAVLLDGAPIVMQGKSADTVAILCSGRAKVSASLRGRPTLLRIASAGDVLGLRGALTTGAYEATAEALGDVVVKFVPTPVLTALAGQHVDFCRNANRAFAERVSEVETLRLISARPTTLTRLSCYLLVLADRKGKPSRKGVRIPVEHTITDLAQLLGGTRETVSRAMSALARDGVIARSGSGIDIVDMHALERLSDG